MERLARLDREQDRLRHDRRNRLEAIARDTAPRPARISARAAGMTVVDSSAVIAILRQETDADTFLDAIDAAEGSGDCFACALAKETGEPLLFKGDDFGNTDIASALDGR